MALVVVVVAFVLMEPATYLAHRFVMHGFAMGWHRSHHRRSAGLAQPDLGRVERNDLFPVVFASATIVVMAVAFNVDALAGLVPVTIGVTLYGAAYLFVHDVYIHRRLPFGPRVAVLEHLSEAHGLHHRFGGEPYGMLVPIVPAALRARAAASRGSAPSQVPAEW